jgi:hypothetical protein
MVNGLHPNSFGWFHTSILAPLPARNFTAQVLHALRARRFAAAVNGVDVIAEVQATCMASITSSSVPHPHLVSACLAGGRHQRGALLVVGRERIGAERGKGLYSASAVTAARRNGVPAR